MSERSSNCPHSHRSKQINSGGAQVGRHLLKTKICSLYMNGRCHYGSERCFYAHSVEELREQPKLEKTSLCPDFKKGRCVRDDCKYAHSVEEMSAASKRVSCLWHRNGHCSHGSACRYSHADSETKESLADDIPRKNSTLSTTTFSPSTTPTVYSPLVQGATSSFDELDNGDCHVASGLSILDLFVTPAPFSHGNSPKPTVLNGADFCPRCGSSIGCICKVFDECPELLRLL